MAATAASIDKRENTNKCGRPSFVCALPFFVSFIFFFLLLLYTNIEHTHTHTPTCPDANTFKTTGMIEQNVYSKMVLLFFSYRNDYDMEEKLIASLRR